jgi:hypothetical protein
MAPTRRGAKREPHRRLQRRRGDEEDGWWRVELVGAALLVWRESVGGGVGHGAGQGEAWCREGEWWPVVDF